jgi:hypothetical protein
MTNRRSRWLLFAVGVAMSLSNVDQSWAQSAKPPEASELWATDAVDTGVGTAGAARYEQVNIFVTLIADTSDNEVEEKADLLVRFASLQQSIPPMKS